MGGMFGRFTESAKNIFLKSESKPIRTSDEILDEISAVNEELSNVRAVKARKVGYYPRTPEEDALEAKLIKERERLLQERRSLFLFRRKKPKEGLFNSRKKKASFEKPQYGFLRLS